ADRTVLIGARWVGHLWPTRAGVALLPGALARGGEDAVVIAETALQQLGPAPQWKMRGVPPVHLQMEFAIPTVAGQAGLGGRQGAGAVDRREVLREDDAAFQFFPARVLAGGKVDGPAVQPKLLSVAAGGGEGRVGV